MARPRDAETGGTGGGALARTDGSGAMFDRIAHRYDMLNRLMSLGLDRGWRKRAVDALQPPPEGRVLDVAAGTADVAIRVARRHPEVRVVALDPSVRMLQIGRHKLRAAGLETRIELLEGDVQRLPFPDGAFDGCTIAFGIRNVPDRTGALREMARVTRPGGRVVVLELTEPQGGLLGRLARWHVRTVVPRLGGLLSGAREYRYLQQSVTAFPTPDEFAAQIRAADLEVVGVRPMTFGSCCVYVAGVPPRDAAEPAGRTASGPSLRGAPS